MILCIGYQREEGILEVVFSNAIQYVYKYVGVPPILYVELMTAESVGGYFARMIKPNRTKYPFTKEPLSAELRKALRL